MMIIDVCDYAVSERHIGFHGVHHIGVLCESLERSLEFYEKILGERRNGGP